MTHPSEATLALYAGGDLSLLARWRTQRHLAGCERCRQGVTEFSAVRSEVAELNELPSISWNRLAAEMKANIRVGLAAGECVAERFQAREFAGRHALAACASLAVLVVAGVWLQHPTPPVETRQAEEDVVLQATGTALELKEGGRVFSLMHRGNANDVIQTVGAQGSMRARYVDPDTGYLTINNVYVQ
jgi:hypothetical protein